MRVTLVVLLLIATSILVTYASIRVQSTPRTLILYEDPSIRLTHADLFSHLKSNGHALTFVDSDDDTVDIKHFDTYLYENIFIFASRVHEPGGGQITETILMDFVDHGGSLFIAPDQHYLSESYRSLASKYGVEYYENDVQVYDSLHSVPLSFPLAQDASRSGVELQISPITSSITGSSPSIRTTVGIGIPMALVQGSTYVKSVVSGNASTVVLDQGKLLEAGPNISFLAVVQLKNNSRIVFGSSTSVFSNAFWSLSREGTGLPYDNQSIYQSVADWMCHDRGLLRVASFHHFNIPSLVDTEYDNNGNSIDPSLFPSAQYYGRVVDSSHYNFKESIHAEIVLEEYLGALNKWVPYRSNDLLFQASILDPYIRHPLPAYTPAQAVESAEAKRFYQNSLISSSDAAYEFVMGTEVRLPDYQGIYTLEITNRETFSHPLSEGTSFVNAKSQVSVRPILHSEHPRFILPAYPYYLSLILISIAFTVFSVLFLFTK